MDDDIKDAFRDTADRLTIPRPALEEVIQGGRRLKWRHRVLASVSITTVVLVAFPFIGILTSNRNDFSPAKPNLEVASRISVGHYPTAVAFGHGAAWVINWDGALQRIDPSTNEVVATFQILGEEPVEDDGSGSDTLPPEPGRDFGTVATGEGAVWVTASSRGGCNLYKIDPAQNKIAASTEVPGCYPIIAAAGSVWLGVGQDGDARDDHLLRLHPTTLAVQDRVTVGPCCMSGITYENGFIWVGQQDVGNTVISQEGDKHVLPMKLAALQVDPTTNRVVNSAPLEGDLYRSGDTLLSLTMTSTADGVWLTRPEPGYVDRIDASSGRVRESVKVDDFRLPDDPQVIGGYVSVTELNGSRIALLDPGSNQVVEVLDTGGVIAQWGASGGGSLWVAHPESNEVLRLALDAQPLPSPSPTPSATRDSPGYVLTTGGTEREWELSVDVRNKDVLCFDFLLEEAPPQSWCDESMMEGAQWVAFHTFRPEAPQKIAFGAVSPNIETLHSDVEGPEHPERPTEFEQTPQGFPRDDLRFFVIIYAPDRDLNLRITDADGDSMGQLTVPATPTFARFHMTYGHGHNEINASVEINALASAICSSAYLPWARAAQLHYDASGKSADPLVTTLFEPPKRFRSDVCASNQDPVVLMRVLDSPQDYYVDYHEKDEGSRRAKAPLGEPTQSNVDP